MRGKESLLKAHSSIGAEEVSNYETERRRDGETVRHRDAEAARCDSEHYLDDIDSEALARLYSRILVLGGGAGLIIAPATSMSLARGTQLGPYEIVGPIGAGGMGEVYRARDPRIGRDVAIKILPAAFSSDPDRLRRFEQETRAVGALNHPNILVIHDIGTHEGAPYVVSELLEGETLRGRMDSGALPQRKAIEYGVAVAQGLAAAHAKRITHRDLKPENIFVTADGRVKILDFGLAKLTQPERPSDDATVDAAPTGTEVGAVLGTIGYMSPEQVRGQPADHRADIFSFGVVLYEMLAGHRAFRGQSAIETMHAILKDEPPDLSALNQNVAPALERLVRRCLEKNPEERFQSASDLSFALESASSVPVERQAAAPPAPAPRRLGLLMLAGGFLLLAAVALGLLIGARLNTRPAPTYHQLTFRRGSIQTARFAPDGQTVVYSAAWEGRPYELFSARLGSRESRPLGMVNAEILAISSTGEMAILLNRRVLGPLQSVGTLARAPLAGGAPREVLENIQDATWSADGKQLLVVRYAAGRSRLEFPIGKVIYETPGIIYQARLSPKGDRIAFFERPPGFTGAWSLVIGDLAGKNRTLSTWPSAWGLAWFASGDEVWFSAAEQGAKVGLYAVTPGGRQRLVERTPDALAVRDVSSEGRVLLVRQSFRGGVLGLAPGETRERDFSWLDTSVAADLSADGKALLLLEVQPTEKDIYLRRTDGSPAVLLGETDGFFAALSPDGKWVLSMRQMPTPQLTLLPTGAGEGQAVARGSIERYMWAGWLPDGARVIFAGAEPGHDLRLYVQDVAGATPAPISPEGLRFTGNPCVSPDGRFVAVGSPAREVQLYPVSGETARPVPGSVGGDTPIRFSSDGRALYVSALNEVPVKVYRIELADGRRQLWKEIALSDVAGLRSGVDSLLMTPDGKSYFYGYARLLSEVYAVEGLR